MALGRAARGFGLCAAAGPGAVGPAIVRRAALPRSGPYTGRPARRAWPTEGLPCHSTGGGAPEKACRTPAGFLLPVTGMAIA